MNRIRPHEDGRVDVMVDGQHVDYPAASADEESVVVVPDVKIAPAPPDASSDVDSQAEIPTTTGNLSTSWFRQLVI